MSILLALLLTLSVHSPPPPLERQVYRFDAGAGALASNHLPLGPGDYYTQDKGYGWLEAPDTSFSRTNLDRFRAPGLRDGVSGRLLEFRADVPAGRWWLTLWMEAGLEDENTAVLSLNGTPTPLNWNAFDKPAEPRTAIQNIYRVFHKPIHVDAEGLQFQLVGRADSVRVLGFSLHPEPMASPETAPFLEQLQVLGSYTTMLYHPGTNQPSVYESLTEATGDLAALKSTLNPDTPLFATYWEDQLDLLLQAERLLAMRGWDWANDETGLSLFQRIHQGIMILDGILDRPDIASFPLYERALFSRARLRHWLKVEGSAPHEIPGIRQPDFVTLHALHPTDSLLAMYNGKRFDIPDACDTLQRSPKAPAWANAQHETLCRLRHIAHWWVTRQQAPNGELGGKYGDDVEILRWWPALILSGDTLTLKGWKRLADGVWNSGRIRDGYAKNVSDVEHASEFVSDTAPVMALFTDDPVYTDRLRPSGRHFEALWSGPAANGHRLFKSAWFSSSAVDERPPRNRDVGYNTRAAKAVRYLAWKTEDAHINNLLNEWSASWVDASMRTDKGKAKGIVPPSLRFPDGVINGDEPSWHIANMYWSYFDWKGQAGSMILDQLLFSYTQTGDTFYLDPLLSTLSLIKTHRYDAKHRSDLQPGSPEWAVQVLLNNARFWSVASQWRMYTGDTRFDDLLQDQGTPYIRYLITQDENHLVTGLQEILDKVRYNTPLLTYEAIHTDRIYVTDSGSGSSHVKAMLTGDGIVEDMSPYPAISWESSSQSLTALVTQSTPTGLDVQLYAFEKEHIPITTRLWNLKPGKYNVTLSSATGNLLTNESVTVASRGQRHTFRLPPDQLIFLSIQPIL